MDHILQFWNQNQPPFFKKSIFALCGQFRMNILAPGFLLLSPALDWLARFRVAS